MEHVNLQYSMEHTPVVRLYIVLNACRGAHCGGCGGGVTPPKNLSLYVCTQSSMNE